jgi:hypothetical protein
MQCRNETVRQIIDIRIKESTEMHNPPLIVLRHWKLHIQGDETLTASTDMVPEIRLQ